MKIVLTCLLSCLLLSIAGCKKETQTAESYNYTFRNLLNQKVYVDMYATESDYNNNVNVERQFSLETYESVTFKLQSLKNAYIDWHSEDYKFTSWAIDGAAAPMAVLPLTPGDKQIDIVWNATHEDQGRQILLSNDKTHTKWHCVGEWQGGMALTQTDERHLQFNKDYSLTYTYGGSDPGMELLKFYYSPLSTVTANGFYVYIIRQNLTWGRFIWDSLSFPLTGDNKMMLEIQSNEIGTQTKYYLFEKD
jgi:hypothetical protein